MSYTENVASKLNELLEKNYDAEAGYKQAAEQVSNPKLKSFFQEQAQARYDFGHQLKSEIKSFGQEPDKGTSLAADVHRTWINIKSTLAGNNEEAVLEECIRGEEEFIEDYNEILNETDLPNSTEAIVREQKNQVQQALNKVRSMEELVD